ncbi:MAG: imidazoleglycerol-phosphate dehydratase HisB [Acidimicrobiales bacterium]|jgi:imidazoleglycerol-phosphate dehydratase
MATNTREAKVPSKRRAQRQRSTKETEISVNLDIDGTGRAKVDTGLPFFDHMLAQLAKHSGIDIELKAQGDLEVDAHHTVEDTGIVLGEALAEALGSKAGVRRFGSIALPLDEALVDVALDLSGRAYLYYGIEMGETAPLGSPPFEAQLAEEFWRALVHGAGITLHIELRRGRNPHHVLEASFKAVARALFDAVAVEGSTVASTKGQL